MSKSYNTKIYDYVDGTHIELFGRSVSKKTQDNKINHPGTDLYQDYENEKAFDAAEQFKKNEYRTDKQKEHCLNVSQNRTKRQIYHITRSNHWDWFITITIDRKIFDASDYDTTVKKLTNFLNNIRKRKAPDLKYLIVPELHADKKNYHFHGLLADTGRCQFIESGHLDDEGEVIYNWIDWHYGFTTATKVKDNGRVSSYITKYITKDTAHELKYKKRYYCSKNINRVDPYLANGLIEEFIINFGSDIDFMKTVSIPGAKQKVTYCEINKKEK